MNNPKTFKKVLVVALALAMVVGAFSMFTFGASATEYVAGANRFESMPAYKLINGGLDFEDYSGTLASGSNHVDETNSRSYLRDHAGMFITNQKDNALRAGARLVQESDGNYALRLQGHAFWINGNVNGARDESKYNQNSMLLDLFNNPNGPKEFSLSMDIKVFGDSGSTSSFAGTSDDGATYLTTKYRGVSGVSFNGTWLFKITVPNLPAITNEIDARIANTDVKRVELADSIPENMKDKGYIYPADGTIVIGALETDEIVTRGFATKPSAKTWEESGKAGTCISQEMMDMDGEGDAILYTLGEYFNVRFDVTRNSNTNITIVTYINDTYLGTTTRDVNAASGNSSDWAYGLRLFDQTSNVLIDNIKATAPENDFGDIHTGAWRSVETEVVKADPAIGGVAIVEKCTRCGEALSTTYPNLVYTGIDSIGVNCNNTTASDSIPATGTSAEVIKTTWHENISGIYDSIKNAPYWINFETELTSVVGGVSNAQNSDGSFKDSYTRNDLCSGGKSFVTWRNNGTGFTQLLRLYKGGELRTIDAQGYFRPNDSTFRLEGTADNPGRYSFHLYIEPASGRYDVYVDDLSDTEPMFYLASGVNYAISTAGSSAPKIRFNDSSAVVGRINNFTVTTAVVAEDHQHNSAYATADDVSVVVGYDTVETGYLCYCGAPTPGGDVVNEQLIVCNNVYYGKATIEGLPTDGEYWITTDVNVRSAEGLAAALESGVMTIGDMVIALPEGATAPATYQYAVKVTADGTDETTVEIYVDGKATATETVAAFDSVTLGGADTTDARFIYTKVVALGDGAQVAVTYNNGVDPSIKPCYHAVSDPKLVTDATGKVFLKGVCSKCGEIVMDDSVKDLHDEAGSQLTYTDGTFSYSTAIMYHLPTEVQGANVAPYQIKFTATLDKMNDTISNLYNSGSGRNFASFFNALPNSDDFQSTLRTFPVSDGNGGYKTDIIEIKSRTTGTPSLGYLKVGESVDVTLAVDPAANKVDIYLNGVYVGTNVKDSPATATLIKFGDGPHPTVTISDFHILVSEGSDHVHSDAWATAEEKSVSMTDKTLDYKYVCYCDDTVTVSGIDFVHNASNVVYGGTGVNVIDGAWYAFDLNVRTEDAMANVPNLIKSGDFIVPAGELKGPATYQYAVNVKANADGTYNVYVFSGKDMACVEYKNVVLAERIDFVEHAYENVRLYNFRTITLGGDAELVFEDTTDYTIRPCNHDWISSFKPVAGETYTAGHKIQAINKLVKTSTCSVCGEMTYSEQGDVLGIYSNYKDSAAIVLDGTGTMSGVARGVRYIGLRRQDIMVGSGAYWISYDVSATFSDAQINKVGFDGANRKENGRSILALRIPMIDDGTTNKGTWGAGGDAYNYIQLMRAYDVGRDDAIGINFHEVGDFYKNGGTIDDVEFVMESGKKYNVAIWVNPTADGVQYKAYIDGVFMYENPNAGNAKTLDPNRVDSSILDEKNAVEERMFTLRFLDGNYGDFSYSNVSIVRAIEDSTEHTHAPLWLNEDEKANSTFVVNKDNTITYTYECYCGETIVAGIDSVLAENITPAYNATEAIVAVEDAGDLVLPGSVITSSFLANELPAEGIKALMTVGGNAIVSVDAEGNIYAGEAATGIAIELGSYYDVALYCTYDHYNVYVGGMFVGSVEYAEPTNESIIVGDEGIGLFHFDKMAIVTLADDGKLSFAEGVDGHAHIFDATTAVLMFNDARTTITVEYICTVCNRPAIDGIVADLYDDATTDETEAIAAVIGTPVGGTTVIEDAIEYVSGKDNFWFSADFVVTKMSNKNRQNVVSLAGTKLVLIDAKGTIRLADEANTVIGEVAEGEMFNVTFNAVDGDGIIAHVYFDGNYCGTLDIAASTALDVKVGDDSALVMNVDNIKLAELGNGGERAIGAFHCDIHKYDPAKADINYLDLDTFVVTNTCVVCGHKVTERPVYNYYAGATAPVLNCGNVVASMNEENYNGETGSYWIVADVNKRSDIAYFDGYANIIGEGGYSYVVMDASGNLYLGNGKAIGQYFGVINGNTTYNVATRVYWDHTDDSGEYAVEVYVDGKYVGSFDDVDVKYFYDDEGDVGFERFGDEKLDGFKFYNIRSLIAGETAPFVEFNYARNYDEIPCGHIYDSNTMTKTAVFGEDIQFVYYCDKCGERVHTLFDVNLYNPDLQTDFILDENGEVRFNSYIHLRSTSANIGSKASAYWVKFKLTVHELNVEAVSANNNNNNGGRNLLNFGTNYNSPLRLYAVKNDKGEYLDNTLIVRSINAAYGNEVARLYEGESVEFALYTNPATLYTEIYVNGQFAAMRKNAFDTSGTHFRILDGNWGDFTISELQFVTTTDIGHVHTAEYSNELGYTPTLAYTDYTLKHTFMCTCGQLITEGVDKALADVIQDIENVTSATAIPEAAKAVISNGQPYWVSAKVFGDGSDATVYSYGDMTLVGIKNGVYTVGNTETDIEVSGASKAGDYDLISINVQPTNGSMLIYINGKLIGGISGDDLFALNESFNVKLGGGAALSFKNIKVVTLADGADNQVTVYGCGTHEFKNVLTVPTVDGTKITFKCRFCGTAIKTVEAGDAKVYSTASGNISISSNPNYIGDVAQPYDTYNNLIAAEDGGNFYVTFDIKPTDLSGLATGGKSLLTWMPGSSTYRWIFRAFKIDNNSAEIKYGDANGTYVDYDTPIVFEKGQTYSVVIESDYVNNLTHVYVNGQYMGAATFVVKNGGATAQYRLRFGDSGTGKWDVTNIKMYNAKKETVAAASTGTVIPTVHTHYPNTFKSHTVTAENGAITQTFTCVCGLDLTLDVMEDLIPNEPKDHIGVYAYKQIFVGDTIKPGHEGTYVVSFDLEVNSVNVAKLINGGDNGRSIVSVGPGLLRLLRGFPVKYVAGQGYTDANGDGYADNVIELKYYNKNRNSLAIMTAGDKHNFTFVIDPDNQRLVIYVDGQPVQTAGGYGVVDYDYIRIFDGNGYGNMNFTNFVVARMTIEDTCQHEIPACTSTEYSYTCTDCGKTFERTHNYVAKGDITGKWIKYECEDCGTYYLAFKDASIVADLTYANKDELMKILTEMYFPIFR